MDEHGARLPVIAKLEKPEAVDNLEAIVLAFDGIMVARGSNRRFGRRLRPDTTQHQPSLDRIEVVPHRL
jgi:hypothetical protein